MKITASTPIGSIRLLANNAVPSAIDYPWSAAIRLKNVLLRKGWTDTDEIPEKFLKSMALDALEETLTAPGQLAETNQRKARQ